MSNNSTKHINEAMNSLISTSIIPPAAQEAEKLLGIKRNQIFIEDDSFIGNPYSLLGRVLEVRSKSGGNSHDIHDGYAVFSAFPIPGIVVDEKSKIKQPLTVKSLIIDNKLSNGLNFLGFLSSQLDSESIYSVIVYDQAVGLLNVHDPNYQNGIRSWIRENQDVIDDADISHLLIVTGMVQKNIIRKRYKKFEVKAKGGAYGINVNGNLYTSMEDYSLDIRFGLSYQRVPLPAKKEMQKVQQNLESLLRGNKDLLASLSVKEMALNNSKIDKLLQPSKLDMDYLRRVKYIK